jgi:beta-N-acetylhexosaminidase
MLRIRASFLLLSVISVAAGCAAPSEEEEDAAPAEESAFTGTADREIGQLFMIEHFGVEPNGYADVASMIKNKNLGSIILWNPQNASGEVARQMVAKYASVARQAGTPELFVSADQEEKGTQRFKSRHGFTDLVDGATLGRAAARDVRACELHGRITAREMASAGMNMSLGTVSDLYTRDSGTPGMFRTRAISSDSNVVASCVREMMKGYAAEKHVVFITKHFPGLGNASGNTDVDPTVRSYSDTQAEIDAEMAPYRTTVASVNADGSAPLFGAMISHASYEILDATKTPATLSPKILGNVLRENVGLRGLTISDAFWTWGATRGLSPVEKRRLMARAFLAGVDILMIAKADFVGAWDYFQMVSADQLPADEKAALVDAAGASDWASLRAKFRARVTESAARIKDAKTKVGPSSEFAGTGEPRAASRELVEEYQRLTR